MVGWLVAPLHYFVLVPFLKSNMLLEESGLKLLSLLLLALVSVMTLAVLATLAALPLTVTVSCLGTGDCFLLFAVGGFRA